jgi:hypothetical protein
MIVLDANQENSRYFSDLQDLRSKLDILQQELSLAREEAKNRLPLEKVHLRNSQRNMKDPTNGKEWRQEQGLMKLQENEWRQKLSSEEGTRLTLERALKQQEVCLYHY